jgi:hypothetical protein
MNREELIQKVLSHQSPDDVRFFVNGNPVSSRFDLGDYKTTDLDENSRLGYYLYSVIAHAIISKAKGKEKAKDGEEILKAYFWKVLEKAPQDIQTDLANEITKASLVLEDFLFSLQKVDVATLIASLYPIVVIDSATRNQTDIDRRLLVSLNKNKEVIFNLTLLYLRSLFHSFLALETTDQMLIKTDGEDPTNGLFTYGTSLMIPTGRNAFSLDGYKLVVKDGIDRANKNFGLSDVSEVTVIYLVKDLLAELTL